MLPTLYLGALCMPWSYRGRPYRQNSSPITALSRAALVSARKAERSPSLGDHSVALSYEGSAQTKRCAKCGEVKPLTAFGIHVGNSDGLRGACKMCRRDEGLQRKYGISSAAYEELHALQGGRCAICGIDESKTRKKLSVDHDHETGAVRKLLCHNCNVILGLAHESAALLKRCADYITAHRD
jgi:hypothetical protein